MDEIVMMLLGGIAFAGCLFCAIHESSKADPNFTWVLLLMVLGGLALFTAIWVGA